jgi:hypothetical protein
LMRSRIVWLLTALLVAGICVWPVSQGFELISYAMADNSSEAVHPWISVPGLAFKAREYALTSTDDSSDDETIRKRRDDLVDMLAIRPLSSFYWLQLAESRVDTKDTAAKESAAFELSKLTGPNEGHVMTQRGLFGIWRWEALSQEERNTAISDFAARRIPDGDLAWLRKALSEKTEKMREDIRSDLEAHGLPKDEFSRVGLN